MTSYVPPIKNGASGWIGYVSLAPRTPSGTWQANPTLATGDVKISLDGGALNNLGTLPVVTPAASKLVKIVLSQAETNADNLTIIFNDAAGAEWCDLTINLQTVARQIDDLAFPVTSGRGIDVDASGGVEVGSFQAGAITAAAIATGAIDADALAADAGTEIATAVWATAARTLTALDEDNTTLDLDTTIRAAVGLASANLDTQLDALPTNAELATALAAADDAMLAAIAALNNITAQSVLTTQMTESYAANGAQMTLAQALYSIQQTIQMFNIDGVHKTVKRLDNVTPAFTITHNSSTAPTGAART